VPNGEFSQLDLADSIACAVRVDGGLRCWGSLYSDEFVVPTGRFVQVSAGAESATVGSGHACAIDEAGALHCWGANRYGQATVPPD